MDRRHKEILEFVPMDKEATAGSIAARMEAPEPLIVRSSRPLFLRSAAPMPPPPPPGHQRDWRKRSRSDAISPFTLRKQDSDSATSPAPPAEISCPRID